MSALFSPFTLKDLTLRNRIAVPPMCQYSANNGYISDWHLAHYTAIARGGAGLVIVEATGVAPEGRISPKCTGLWEDGQIAGMAQIAQSIKAAGAVAGIQIAHAGRKASANIPWEGDDHIPDDAPNGWPIIGPSAEAFGANLPKVPKAMTLDDIARVKQNFVDGAKRALEAGFEWLELHFAHGYLAQSFFSVHANKRTDEYGGDAEGRGRFLRETLQAVRAVWPEKFPLTLRFGVIEFDGRDEETLQESIELIKHFKADGTDLLSVSMGFNTPKANIPWGPAFLTPYVERVRNEAGIPVASAWGYDDPKTADAVVKNKQLDLVMIGRAHLANPFWPMHAAKVLEIEKPTWVLPAPYAHWLEKYSSTEK